MGTGKWLWCAACCSSCLKAFSVPLISHNIFMSHHPLPHTLCCVWDMSRSAAMWTVQELDCAFAGLRCVRGPSQVLQAGCCKPCLQQ